ncbi:hypothetical protein GO491_03790 [Flavobacteriaceae bacterium Ap0902]|nr:hypothetical protein [Flavobacteriaceae bacterium Ap0902]
MKNITPSLLGCGGIFVLIGLILLIFFRDRIGAEVFTFGLWLVGAIVLFWLFTLFYKKLK